MPVSTDTLDEDIKELRGEMKEIRARLDGLSDRFSTLSGEIRIALRVAAWGGMLLAATLVTGGVAAVFWAGRIDGQVKTMADRFEKLDGARIVIPTNIRIPDHGPNVVTPPVDSANSPPPGTKP